MTTEPPAAKPRTGASAATQAEPYVAAARRRVQGPARETSEVATGLAASNRVDTLGAVRSLAVKRLMDVAGATVGLLCGAPVLMAVAALVRIKLGSPVLFRQTRPGLREHPFVILKFRTMRDAADGEGRELPDEQRLTPLGRFLRATSLDELPELLNVLVGDMSLVGPRPLLMEYLPRYNAMQRRRHAVKPGLTGWAAVNGRNALGWNEKFALDTWYVDNWSNELDFRILLSTVKAVLRREGVTHQAHATMPKFEGQDASNCESGTEH